MLALMQNVRQPIAQPHARTPALQSYELCSDMIDVVIDVSCIYGLREGDEEPQVCWLSCASLPSSPLPILHPDMGILW